MDNMNHKIIIVLGFKIQWLTIIYDISNNVTLESECACSIVQKSPKSLFSISAVANQHTTKSMSNEFISTHRAFLCASVLYHMSVQPPAQTCVSPGSVGEAPHCYTATPRLAIHRRTKCAQNVH